MQPNNIRNPVKIVPITSTNEPTEASKTSMRPAVNVFVEKEVTSVKLSARALAFAHRESRLEFLCAKGNGSNPCQWSGKHAR